MQPHPRHHRGRFPLAALGLVPLLAAAHHHHHRGHRGRWADPESMFDFPWGRFGRRWGGGGPGERLFSRGDLKYVILDLLAEQPRHGYDIIRALEERFRGWYRPSPGSVYPTLQMLEDLGYVTVQQQEGKKVYAITDEGRRFLADRAPTFDDIRSRISATWESAARPELGELMHELREFGRALFRHGTRGALGDAERLRQLRQIVQRARQEVERLDAGEARAAGASSTETTIL